jgi:hypothetical protein
MCQDLLYAVKQKAEDKNLELTVRYTLLLAMIVARESKR